jgi:hypothetical protein
MDARDAFERRAARLAILLTDDRELASAAMADVLRAHTNLERVGETMVERSIVQACRARGRGAGGASPVVPVVTGEGAQLWASARALDSQEWEAWVLREVEGENEIRVARAMDSSKNAIAEVHLAPAVKRLRAGFASPTGYDTALAALRTSLDAIDPAPVLERAREARTAAIRRRRMITAIQLALLAACFAAMIFVLIDLLGWDEREAARESTADPFSNPIPAQDTSGAVQ